MDAVAPGPDDPRVLCQHILTRLFDAAVERDDDVTTVVACLSA